MRYSVSQVPLLAAVSGAFAVVLWLTACSTTNPNSPDGGSELSIHDRAASLGYGNVAAIPGIRVNLPYRTSNNAAGRPLYPWKMPCLANRGTVRKLARAQEILAAQGYGLLVWDAWRPPKAQLGLWNAVKNPNYVIPPSAFLSRHCYGIAVDVTLVNSSGRPMKMPTGYDEFSSAAASDYRGFDPVVQKNLEILQGAMRSAGFETIPKEWWHFEDRNPSAMRVLHARELGLKIP